MELVERIKRHFAFSVTEIRDLFATIIVYGLIISFSFDLAEVSGTAWLAYLIPSILIAALSILIHVSVIRINGLDKGYFAEYRAYYYALAFALVISIVTRGKLMILVPGVITFHMLEGLRLGGFRYGINLKEIRWSFLAGSLANLTLALFFRVLANMGSFAGNPLLEKVIAVNLIIAFVSMLPIPGLNGLTVYHSSQLVYAFMFSLVAGACLVIYLNIGFWLSIILPIIIGVAGWLIYLIKVDM